MAGKSKVKLTARDPSGRFVTIRTAADYRYAGFAKDVAGNWSLVAKGWSRDSVHARTLTYARKWICGTGDVTTARLWELDETVTPKAAADYFARHPLATGRPLTLAGLFFQGQGWVDAAPGQPLTLGMVIGYRNAPVVPPSVTVTDGVTTTEFSLADLATI